MVVVVGVLHGPGLLFDVVLHVRDMEIGDVHFPVCVCVCVCY